MVRLFYSGRLRTGASRGCGCPAGRDFSEGLEGSADGGATWSELGSRDIGKISDLGLGIDGQNLYAATDQGLWRISLH